MEQGQLTCENLYQGDLTQEELALLNNLMYIQDSNDNIKSDITNYKGRIFSDFIEDYCRNNYEKINELPEGAADNTHEQWIAMLDKISKDEQLMNLKITEQMSDDKGGNAICLENPDYPDKATVVFRGTGKYEWIDNGEGGYTVLTEQQKEAINWVNSLPEKYTSITSTGHSKGGNKAQIVAILCDRVVRCVAYDGQGVGEEFLSAFAEQINSKKDNITLISSQGDYVNILFFDIAGTKVYTQSDETLMDRIGNSNTILDNVLLKAGEIPYKLLGLALLGYNEYNGIIDAGREHCPTTVLSFENGEVKLRETADQDPSMKVLHDFVMYFTKHAVKEDKIYLFNLCMNLLQGEEQKIDVGDIPNGFKDRFITLLTDWANNLNVTSSQKRKLILLLSKSIASAGFLQKDVNELNDILSDIGIQMTDTYSSYLNNTIRDFSKAAQDKLIAFIRDVEGENPLFFKKWPQWDALDGVRSRLSVDGYHNFIDVYYNDLIDKNNESIEKINEIFEKVYDVDKEYGESLDTICNKIQNIQKSIKEITQKFNTQKVEVDLSVLKIN